LPEHFIKVTRNVNHTFCCCIPQTGGKNVSADPTVSCVALPHPHTHTRGGLLASFLLSLTLASGNELMAVYCVCVASREVLSLQHFFFLIHIL